MKYKDIYYLLKYHFVYIVLFSLYKKENEIFLYIFKKFKLKIILNV